MSINKAFIIDKAFTVDKATASLKLKFVGKAFDVGKISFLSYIVLFYYKYFLKLWKKYHYFFYIFLIIFKYIIQFSKLSIVKILIPQISIFRRLAMYNKQLNFYYKYFVTVSLKWDFPLRPILL